MMHVVAVLGGLLVFGESVVPKAIAVLSRQHEVAFDLVLWEFPWGRHFLEESAASHEADLEERQNGVRGHVVCSEAAAPRAAWGSGVLSRTECSDPWCEPVSLLVQAAAGLRSDAARWRPRTTSRSECESETALP